MCPPECREYSVPIEIDKVHAYLLGKGLYDYLQPDSSGNKLLGKDDGEDFDFSNAVFQTVTGEKIKQLIIDLVKPVPADRLSVAEAGRKIAEMRALSAVKEPRSMPLPKELASDGQFNQQWRFFQVKEGRINSMTPICTLGL
jgi:hypothetical protein